MGAQQSTEAKVELEESATSSWEDIEEEDDEEEEEEELYEERLRIIEETRKMKQMAGFFLHPEAPVQVDCCACARSFFDRPSAPFRLSLDQANEMAALLEDAKALKQLAVHYRHSELPAETTDPAACARNYFCRFSAPDRESLEEAEERAKILQEAKALQQLAADYHHPEIPVTTRDPYACGRNYFARFSGASQESLEDVEDREGVLTDVARLKQLAVDYHHPEIPVVTTDPRACARNYFCRPSSIAMEDPILAEERELVMKDVARLKQLAIDYHYPEKPVITTDPYARGRNFFCRPSSYATEEELGRGDLCYHQAHFDMDDEVHAHHAEFDMNPNHHEAISKVRQVPYGMVGDEHLARSDHDNSKLSSSPECIMFFANKRNHAV